MEKIVGLAGAKGQAVLGAAILGRRQPLIERRPAEDATAAVGRFHLVRKEYIARLESLYQKTLQELGEEPAKIFKAYQTIAADDLFFKKPLNSALQEGIYPDYPIEMEKQRVSRKFAAMDDPYMRERASDIVNVCDELLRRLHGIGESGLEGPAGEPFLVVAEDLSPEDTVRIDKTLLGGFITEKGGATSHAVILAKTLGIPAVVGAKGILQKVKPGQLLYLNGGEGYALIEPDEAFLREFAIEKEKLAREKALYEGFAARPAVTQDGHEVAVCINSGDEESIKGFSASTCDGVGLFRTEFLFMGQRSYPSEELQFSVYRRLAEKTAGKEVIIRTLDIGGDKQLDYMDIPAESNPFLGYRAIRICLDRPEVFLTQLRAILRASHYGHIKIMFPMVVTCEELLQAKAFVQTAMGQLRERGLPFDEGIQTGIMVETPASVLLSDQLARHADFFSIGTNDLIQYTTATDRMNEKVQYLYNPCNLSVLRAVNQTIQNGHKAGIRVGMCGEMASDERLVPFLLGRGLDEFSVVPSQVGRLKYMISKLNFGELQVQTESILQTGSIQEAETILKNFEVNV
ncbi:MAG: phosphoenolpyruvate--protein phosphotransferase [Oscillospiraceae bacterium]